MIPPGDRFFWETVNKKDAEIERLREERNLLVIELYSTQCKKCAGHGMPSKAALYCARCGEPVARVLAEEE